MVAFYRRSGFDVAEHPHVVSVYVGDQMINFHRPATWQRESFTLRARRTARAAVRRSLLRVGRHAGGAARAARRRGRRGRARARSRAKAAAAPTRRACTCATPTATSSSS